MTEENTTRTGIKIDAAVSTKDLAKATAVITAGFLAKYFLTRAIVGAATRNASEAPTPKS